MACRISKILVDIYPSKISLEKLVCFDFMIVNIEDFFYDETSLHPAIPRRDAQLAIKRDVMLDAIFLLKKYDLIIEWYMKKGFLYSASEKTFSFTNSYQNSYVRRMEHNINIVKNHHLYTPERQLQELIKSKFGKLDMEFNYE